MVLRMRSVAWCLIVLLAACSTVREASDAGFDAGRCEPNGEWTEGSILNVHFLLCPREAPIYWSTTSGVTAQEPDGGVFSLLWTAPYESCEVCPTNWVSDSFFAFGMARPGWWRDVGGGFNGRVFTGESNCPGTTISCSMTRRVPPGDYQARFCISRTALTNDGGYVTGLGPLECQEVPFRIPFDGGSIGATFE